MHPIMANLQKTSILTFIFFLFLFSTPAQSQSGVFDLNFEFQAYPTGLIPGLRLEKGFADRHALHLRLGYNWIRHRDLGEHGDERGDGYGFSLGYKYYFRDGFEGWFLGLRDDTWFNTLDWEDYDANDAVINSGTSEIVVVQPTAEAGYTFTLGNGGWTLTPNVAFGFEINVQTEGADVGQGAILLLGVKVGPRF